MKFTWFAAERVAQGFVTRVFFHYGFYLRVTAWHQISHSRWLITFWAHLMNELPEGLFQIVSCEWLWLLIREDESIFHHWHCMLLMTTKDSWLWRVMGWPLSASLCPPSYIREAYKIIFSCCWTSCQVQFPAQLIGGFSCLLRWSLVKPQADCIPAVMQQGKIYESAGGVFGKRSAVSLLQGNTGDSLVSHSRYASFSYCSIGLLWTCIQNLLIKSCVNKCALRIQIWVSRHTSYRDANDTVCM